MNARNLLIAMAMFVTPAALAAPPRAPVLKPIKLAPAAQQLCYTNSVQDAREDRRDAREDRRDAREDRLDRLEDRLDALVFTGPADIREDIRDAREDRLDRAEDIRDAREDRIDNLPGC